jgi:hypothetical protein
MSGNRFWRWQHSWGYPLCAKTILRSKAIALFGFFHLFYGSMTCVCVCVCVCACVRATDMGLTAPTTQCAPSSCSTATACMETSAASHTANRTSTTTPSICVGIQTTCCSEGTATTVICPGVIQQIRVWEGISRTSRRGLTAARWTWHLGGLELTPRGSPGTGSRSPLQVTTVEQVTAVWVWMKHRGGAQELEERLGQVRVPKVAISRRAFAPTGSSMATVPTAPTAILLMGRMSFGAMVSHSEMFAVICFALCLWMIHPCSWLTHFAWLFSRPVAPISRCMRFDSLALCWTRILNAGKDNAFGGMPPPGGFMGGFNMGHMQGYPMPPAMHGNMADMSKFPAPVPVPAGGMPFGMPQIGMDVGRQFPMPRMFPAQVNHLHGQNIMCKYAVAQRPGVGFWMCTASACALWLQTSLKCREIAFNGFC